MERLKSMKETLVGCVQGQMSHLDSVDIKELGEAIDMIKDLEEAIYYASITKAMKEKEEKKEEHHYYTERYIPNDYRDMDINNGRMFYPDRGSYMYYEEPVYYNGNGRTGSNGNGRSSGGNNARGGGTRGYDGYPLEIMRDLREGCSGQSRKSYMESKEMHHDKTVQLKELEKYMQELGKDITEMISDASPEERQMLHSKLTALASKVQ